MKRLKIFIILQLLFIVMHAATPFCRIETFDENSGLSQHVVIHIVMDRYGMLWFATWNGINRFDGNEFAPIRPGINDDIRRYSSRFRDMMLSSKGNIWCRIDDKLVLFDIDTYKFSDINSALEEKFGRIVSMKEWYKGRNGELIVECVDGPYIILSDENPAHARQSEERPAIAAMADGDVRLERVGEYSRSRQVYSRRDSIGGQWAIVKDGAVVYGESDSAPAPVRGLAGLGLVDDSVKYCTADSDGKLWLCSKLGAHRVSLGYLPYERVPDVDGCRILAMGKDLRGRIWIADNTRKAVSVYSPDMRSVSYLGPDGKLSTEFKSFGHPVYSIKAADDGTMWLGSKPDGLFRLMENGAGYSVRWIAGGHVYDTLIDKEGRLWAATLGQGVVTVESPSGEAPVVRRLRTLDGYPEAAKSCRRLIADGDSMILVATTAGLLRIFPHGRNGAMDFNLCVTRPGDVESLGCVAVMDLLSAGENRLYVATESDAVNVCSICGDIDWKFSRHSVRPAFPSDVAIALTGLDSGKGFLVVSYNLVYSVGPDGNVRVYGEGFWQGKMRFRECRPLRLDDGRWLFGLEDGLVMASLSPEPEKRSDPRLAFTSVSIENQPDSLLSASTDRIVLDKNQRNITLHFSAQSHCSSEGVAYEFRFHDGEWTRLGSNRSITLLGLSPGTYELEVRLTDGSGADFLCSRSLILRVEPKFYETALAKILFGVIIVILILLAIRLYIYVRDMKRKQNETLEAYLSLLSKNQGRASDEKTVADEPSSRIVAEPVAEPEITEADRLFMDRIVDYVNNHLSDTDASVDDMAEAAAVSRSGLTRKMRSLMGVTPADFLRQARLNHAAELLAKTDVTMKEIAFECGFADLNYFGKCFKAAYGLTPTAYRKEKSYEESYACGRG